MSADKYPSIFSRQMVAIVYIFSPQMEAIVYVAKRYDFYVPAGKAIVAFSTSVFSKNLNHKPPEVM